MLPRSRPPQARPPDTPTMNELHYATGFDGFPLELHQAMVQDRLRVRAFHGAMKEVIRPGDVVVDVGSGTGVLSFLAYKCGARRVIGLERSDIVHTARRAKELNFPDAPIEFLRTDARTGRLPRVRANVIVCELLGNFGLEEEIVPVLRRVRERMLAPGGRMIPSGFDLLACPVESRQVQTEITGWRRRHHDIDFSPFQDLAFSRVYHLQYESVTRLAKPVPMSQIDLMTIERAPRKMEATFVATRAGRLHGIATWFDARLSPSHGLSSGPKARNTHWGQVYFPVGDPIRVERGARIRFSLRTRVAALERTWTWSGSIQTPGGRGERTFERTASEAL